MTDKRMNDELAEIRKKKEQELVKSIDMPRDIIHLRNLQALKNTIEQFPDNLIVIDCSAVWCGPCKWYTPIFEQIQKDFQHHFVFAKVDVDEARDIAIQYGIQAVPTTLFLKNGKIVGNLPGAIPYEKLKELMIKFKEV